MTISSVHGYFLARSQELVKGIFPVKFADQEELQCCWETSKDFDKSGAN
jgi:hypothetical protein